MLAAANEMSTSIGTTASWRTSVSVDMVPRLNARTTRFAAACRAVEVSVTAEPGGERRVPLAEVVVALHALEARAARDRPAQDDPIARGDAVDAVADRGDHAGTLVAEDEWDRSTDEVVIGVAHPGRLELDEHFAGPRIADLDRLHRERSVPVTDHCSRFHLLVLLGPRPACFLLLDIGLYGAKRLQGIVVCRSVPAESRDAGTLRHRVLGTTDVEVTRLGLGTAPLGGWPEAVTAEEGRAAIESAWASGLRYFDTAPFYGFGQSEIWLGDVLRDRDRDSYVLSTKVGRLLEPRRSSDPPLFQGARPFDAVFDFSYDGTMRSFESSLERLGIGRIDIALIHDPDDSLSEALDGAYAALAELRDAGRRPCDRRRHELPRAARLPDRAGRPRLRPARRSVHTAGPGRAGRVASAGREAQRLDHRRRGVQQRDPRRPASRSDVRLRAGSGRGSRPGDQLEEVCDSFGVPLAAAALQFPLGHPAVAAVLTGARSRSEVHENVHSMRTADTRELWDTLTEQGLLRADAPRPAS